MNRLAWVGSAKVFNTPETGDVPHDVVGAVYDGRVECHALAELHLDGGNVIKVRECHGKRIEVWKIT